MTAPRLAVQGPSGREDAVELSGFACFAAGYTGRDKTAIDRHIEELKDHGVPPPARVPCCYPLLPHLLAVAPEAIDVYGTGTSGEIEPVLLVLDGRPRYVAVGSDHTDRDQERRSVPLAKQLCPKVISAIAWDFDEVADHWDELLLESRSDGELYQSSKVSAMLPVADLLATVPPDRQTARMAIFCGTVPLVAGIRFAAEFRGSLKDPVRGRSLEVGYGVRVLSPID